MLLLQGGITNDNIKERQRAKLNEVNWQINAPRRIEFFNSNYATILTTENKKKATRLYSFKASIKNIHRDSVEVFILT